MKLCIFGSRDFYDYKLLKSKIDEIHGKTPIYEVVSGKARGADSLGERWAKENNIKISEFPADWDKFGKSAGYIRNKEMAAYCDCGAGFSISSSRGTAMMKGLLDKMGKKTYFWEIS